MTDENRVFGEIDSNPKFAQLLKKYQRIDEYGPIMESAPVEESAQEPVVADEPSAENFAEEITEEQAEEIVASQSAALKNAISLFKNIGENVEEMTGRLAFYFYVKFVFHCLFPHPQYSCKKV